MSIHLFEHNQKAYEAVTEMLEKDGMAAVIHPTGTGKSMIAFKLVEEHPLNHFLWLSPSEYIYQTQVENLNMKFPNIQFMSYSRLMKNEDCIETLHPDYIILDEFHRCGAREWGKSIKNCWIHIQMPDVWACQQRISAIWTIREIWRGKFLMEKSHLR